MDRISVLVKESADGAYSSAKACQNLTGLAMDLQKMVGKFQLGTSTHHNVPPRGQSEEWNDRSPSSPGEEEWSDAARHEPDEPSRAFGAGAS
jgi:hypothetical protein